MIVSKLLFGDLRGWGTLHFIAAVLAPRAPSSKETDNLGRKLVCDNLTNVFLLDFLIRYPIIDNDFIKYFKLIKIKESQNFNGIYLG